MATPTNPADAQFEGSAKDKLVEQIAKKKLELEQVERTIGLPSQVKARDANIEKINKELKDLEALYQKMVTLNKQKEAAVVTPMTGEITSQTGVLASNSSVVVPAALTAVTTKPAQADNLAVKVERTSENLQEIEKISEIATSTVAIQHDTPSVKPAPAQRSDPKSPAAVAPAAEPEGVAAVLRGNAAAPGAAVELTASAAAPGADALLTVNAKALVDKEAAEKEARLKSAAAEGATLTAAGTAPKSQPVLEADTETPEKKLKGQLDEFPKFPTSDWVAQLMWLLDILFFNSNIGRPPGILSTLTDQTKGFIEKVGEGFANLAADFKEKLPNVNRLISGTVGAAVNIATNVVKGVGKAVIGGLQIAQGAVVTTVGGAVTGLIVAPIAALSAPKGQKAQAFADSFGFVNKYGIKPAGHGFARAIDGVLNVASVVPTAVGAVVNATTGAIGMVVGGFVGVGGLIAKGIDKLSPTSEASKGYEQAITRRYDAAVAGADTIKDVFDKATSVLSGNDPKNPLLFDRFVKGIEPKVAEPSSKQLTDSDRKLAAETAKAAKDAVTPAPKGSPAAVATTPTPAISLAATATPPTPAISLAATVTSATASTHTTTAPEDLAMLQQNVNHDTPPAHQSKDGHTMTPQLVAAIGAAKSLTEIAPAPAPAPKSVAPNTDKDAASAVGNSPGSHMKPGGRQ